MGSLKEALKIERNRLFVGRKPELGFMDNWLAQNNPPTEVLFISGMAGIGKSALMLQFLNRAQEEHMQCVWMDGRLCTETPAGFLESLHAALTHNLRSGGLSQTHMSALASTLSGERTLLCIDNYEHLQAIEGWLREVFLPQLSDIGLLIVFAARQDLSSDWSNDLAWRKRVRQMHLAPISRNEAQNFYTNMGLDKKSEVERLIRGAKGLPLAMALSAEKAKMAQSNSETGAWPISMRVSAELLREVATPDMKELLDLLCILPQANADLLGRLLDAPLSALNLHQLSQISFVRPTVGGFSLHDVAREYLIEDFLHREPVRYGTLRLRIVEEVVKQLKKADSRDKKRIASDLLAVCRETFRLGSISLISCNPLNFTLEPYRTGDLPHLHRLITEQGSLALPLDSAEKYHELLDSLAREFPDRIHVFRSDDGIALAFISRLLLYCDTIAFLEPFMPGVLEACFPDEFNKMKQRRLEEADTCYELLAACAVNDANYSFLELNGILLTDSLSRNSSLGMRSVFVTKLVETNEYFRNIGLRVELLPTLPEEHPFYGACINELDLRNSDFGDYVLALLNVSTTDRQIIPDINITDAEIRAALTSAGNTAALQRSKLVHKLNCSGTELYDRLQNILFSMPPTYPLDRRKQKILQLLSSEPSLAVEAAAERLHVSRATYYRSRNEALGDLKQLLLECINFA